jgi:hypothetical protein
MRRNDIIEAAATVGLKCWTGSPGDGTTQYHLYLERTGPGNPLYKARGARDAMAFCKGWGACKLYALKEVTP